MLLVLSDGTLTPHAAGTVESRALCHEIFAADQEDYEDSPDCVGYPPRGSDFGPRHKLHYVEKKKGIFGLQCGDVWNGCTVTCSGRNCPHCGDDSAAIVEEKVPKDESPVDSDTEDCRGPASADESAETTRMKFKAACPRYYLDGNPSWFRFTGMPVHTDPEDGSDLPGLHVLWCRLMKAPTNSTHVTWTGTRTGLSWDKVYDCPIWD